MSGGTGAQDPAGKAGKVMAELSPGCSSQGRASPAEGTGRAALRVEEARTHEK